MKTILVTDEWYVMDRWWTETPIARSFIALEAPDGSKACVSYDEETKEWTIREEPDVTDEGTDEDAGGAR